MKCDAMTLAMWMSVGVAVALVGAAGAAEPEKPDAAPATPAPPAASPAGETDWRESEKSLLIDPVQLTFPTKFARAGEAYFSRDASWIIFQAIPVPEEGKQADPIYSMYVAMVKRAFGTDNVSGIDEPIRISPEGSANTCGFFHPREPWRVIFGSTLVRPAEEGAPGYQRATSRYRWMFPVEMEVVRRVVPEVFYGSRPGLRDLVTWSDDETTLKPLFVHRGYDAECAYSPDGRHIVYSSMDPQTQDADLWVYDTSTKERRPLVTSKGYDGGPFFSPDGKAICYRSDRAGNDLLQVYVADLVIDSSGAITGLRGERAVTANEHVNWAPFWHPSGKYLVYATSEVSHANYEVFAVEAPVGESVTKKASELRKKRITYAPGFDGLPVFSSDAKLMMWTSQRGPKLDSEEKPSSQLWVAKVGEMAP